VKVFFSFYKRTRMFRPLVILSISALLLGSCKLFKPAQSDANPTSSTTSTESVKGSAEKRSEVLSILLNVTAGDKPISFEVRKVNHTEGYLKKDTRPVSSKQLIAVFSDADNKVVDIVPFNDPTKERKESVDENGNIVTVQSSSANLVALIRVNYNSYIYRLEIQDASGKKLQSIEIKKYIK